MRSSNCCMIIHGHCTDIPRSIFNRLVELGFQHNKHENKSYVYIKQVKGLPYDQASLMQNLSLNHGAK